jgi:hypothetical protein
VTDVLDDAKIEDFILSFLQKLEQSIADDTNLWKDIILGRQIFNIFARSVGLDSSRLRMMYIRESSRINPSPFEEIVGVFRTTPFHRAFGLCCH